MGDTGGVDQLLLQLIQVGRDEFLCLFDGVGDKGAVAAPGGTEGDGDVKAVVLLPCPFDGLALGLVGCDAEGGFLRGGKVPAGKPLLDLPVGKTLLPQFPHQLHRADTGEHPPFDAAAGGPGQQPEQHPADRHLPVLGGLPSWSGLPLLPGEAGKFQGHPISPVPGADDKALRGGLVLLLEEPGADIGEEHPQDTFYLVVEVLLVPGGKDDVHGYCSSRDWIHPRSSSMEDISSWPGRTT